MRLAIFVLLAILFSCEGKKDIEEDIARLKTERNTLEQRTSTLNRSIQIKYEQIHALDEKLKEKGILTTGRQPIYIVDFKLTLYKEDACIEE